MKNLHLTIAAAMILLSAAAANAQSEVNNFPTTIAGRVGASVDWKAAKGLHFSLAYELRAKDSFKGIERHNITLDASYKVNKWFKVGGGYTFIGHYNSTNTFKPRHRVYVDATEMYSFGNWKLSLKEKFQFTHRPYDLNPYQTTRNNLALRTRFKVDYKGFREIEPYAFVSLWTCLNDPAFTATYDSTTKTYSDYQFKGYTDVYLNHIHSAIGLVWNFDRHNSIDLCVFGDWYHNKDIDTNKEGTKLKSFTWKNGFRFSPGIVYKLSF